MAISGLGPPQSNFATVGASPLRSDDTRPANMLTAPLQPGGSRGSQTFSERLEKSWEPYSSPGTAGRADPPARCLRGGARPWGKRTRHAALY